MNEPSTPVDGTAELPSGSELRKTPRENAGIPPERLGVFHLESVKKKKKAENKTNRSLPERPTVTTSRKSAFSSQSVVQIKRLELEGQKKVSEMRRQMDIKERDIKNLELDVDELKVKVKRNFTIIQDQANSTDEQRQFASAQNVEYLQNIEDLEADIRRAQTNFGYDVVEFQRQEKLIMKEVEVQAMENEDGSQEVSSVSDTGSTEIDKWAGKTVLHVPQDPTVNKEDNEEEKAAGNEGDIEDGGSTDVDEANPKSSKPKVTKSRKKKKDCSNQFNLEDIAAILADAIKGATKKSPNKVSDKILARQVQGRELPQFSGRPEEWPSFMGSYEVSTKNCSFTNAENLPRLQKCLKGEALKAVQCLLVHPDGVPAVIEKLKMRFGRPALVIEAMIQKLKDVPHVKLDKSETFIEFGIAVDNLVSTISSLKQPQHLSNPSLMQELVKKLPMMTQMEWIRSQPSDNPSLEDFALWIASYTDAACKLFPPTVSMKKSRGGRFEKRNERVFATTEEKRNPKPEKKCPFCNNRGHPPRSCPTFCKADVNARWQLVRDKKCCFGCLNLGHRFEDCRSKRTCGENGCKAQHQKLLHQDRPSDDRDKPKANGTEGGKTEEVIQSATEAVMSCSLRGEVVHMMSPIVLEGPNGKVEGFAILDGLSSVTTIESAVIDQLGIEGKVVPLTIKGFNSTRTYSQSQLVDVAIHSSSQSYQCTLNNVRTVENIEHRQSVFKSDMEKWPHLRGLDIPVYQDAKPTILIGLDHPQLHVQLEYRVGKSANAPIAVRTPLGWTIMGKMSGYQKIHRTYMMREEDEILHNMVKESFAIDAIGINANAAMPRSTEDTRAQTVMDSTLRRVSNGWEKGLLWRDNEVILPSSKELALTRLKQMERRMDKDEEFAKQYQAKIDEYQSKGFARKLTEDEAKHETGKTFYLPHFMATNPKKPAKYRFVFDAAARVKGKCLNDFLLRGPDKLVSLPGVLLRFRQGPIGITADIQDMFHRVKVRKEDAQAQRFLWRGKNRTENPEVFEMGVLIFGATCSPTCAQEVKNQNALEFQKEFPEACESILKNHYVDDLLDSKNSVEAAIRLFKEIREVHSKGGFNLCNWLSNSKEVMESIPEDLRAKSMKSLDFTAETTERVLGLFWRPEDDVFTFSLSFLKAQTEVLSGKKVPTKREVLSLVMSIYDPLGFLATLTVKAKTIIQKCWVGRVDWDQVIPREIEKYWMNWLQEMKNIPDFRMMRCYHPRLWMAEDVQLHVFGDASEEAYGTVIHLRIKYATEVNVAFVMAKSKVAPIKVVSIPRLELQAALMGARLATFVKKELDIKVNRTVLWSDSWTAICWIRSDGKTFHQFVAHRVGEIQEESNITDWKWIPTEENVADEMTRINHPCDWSESSRWINGPEFLKKEESEWPKEPHPKGSEVFWDEALLEKRKTILVMQEVKPIIDLSRFSNYRKLIHATSYVLRFAKRKKTGSKVLSKEEMASAEEWWWRADQGESYPQEVLSLKKDLPIERQSPLWRSSLAMDEKGVIRVQGRLENADIPIGVKHPVVLSPKHPFTVLLIQHYHQICGHHGHERIGNELRQQFYIPKLRTAIRRAVLNCQICKNNKAKPRVPEMGQLPKSRVEMNVYPFTRTGLDYFGPIEVVVQRSRVKRYVALFTCMSTRAVHLEIAGSLTTDSCIMAIRRFVCRRGCPTEILSDNGTNFHGANNELKAALKDLDQDQLNGECNNNGILWTFNPPSAPHMGGSWERLVRSVKIAMADVLKIKNLSEEVLHTVLIEAEHTVNSHPLTHVPDDPDDPEALTPNHFLIGRSSNLQPIGVFKKSDLFDRKQWRVVQQMANHFWKRWVKGRQKWCEVTKPIQEGDVILEINGDLPRNSWPKGRVIKTFPGKDGCIRVVDIKLANGSIYRRPVSKLCILDVQIPEQDTKQDKNTAEA